jgi:hypothetical protein
MSIIEKLTEGVVRRDVQKEGAAVLNKWEKTGLLEGIGNDHVRNNMACLLENQAKELLREASTMSGGDVEGFAAVAFPIVRRVFGGLIANELVSVQPMSLPSGLIFFLDFTFSGDGVSPDLGGRLGNPFNTSVYGGGKVGQQITGGVLLGPDQTNNASLNNERSFYSTNNGYASPTGSVSTAVNSMTRGIFGAGNADLDSICRYDPDLISGTSAVYVFSVPTSTFNSNGLALNEDDLISITVSSSAAGLHTPQSPGMFRSDYVQIRRLTQFSGSSKDNILVVAACVTGGSIAAATDTHLKAAHTYTYAAKDAFQNAVGADPTALGAIEGTTAWGLENQTQIPEIDIKVDSVSVTALTKKLKAKWTPELQQDINAYHNLDAEVELTSLLSEQIALEIDQEILQDLIAGATAGTLYWSRRPGKFVNKTGGGPITSLGTIFPDFTGTVSKWYETLLETVNDVSAQIHRKTLRGGANFIVVSPEVASILEFTSGFRADTTVDENRGTAGAVKVGQLSKKLDIYVDPYFLRNVILVGRKGNSFLESGYVYAPYVPLQVTPTIFDPESFVPRKGVMTRYAKKMVRPDMYGLVICEDLLG